MSKDLFSLKMFFIKDQDDPRMAVLIENQRRLVEASLAHLNERKKRLFSSPQAIRESYGHYQMCIRDRWGSLGTKPVVGVGPLPQDSLLE